MHLDWFAKLQQFVVFGRWTEAGLEKELESFRKNIWKELMISWHLFGQILPTMLTFFANAANASTVQEWLKEEWKIICFLMGGPAHMIDGYILDNL